MTATLLDLLIILVYIVIILVVGFYVGRKEGIEDFLVNRRKTKRTSSVPRHLGIEEM